MKLAEFSTKNSLLVNMVSLFIIIAGLRAMVGLPRDAFPQVDFDIVRVTTAYPGAPAEDVEKFVTIPIEKELRGISGVKEMESSSEEGLSSIVITIDPQASDKDQVVDDIKEAVDRVHDLPEGVEDDPVVLELKSKERPIMEISISGAQPEAVKRRYAETLEDLFLDIDGVASVQRFGWRDREFWVELFPDKLREYHVAMDEIVRALRARNVTLPGGQLVTETAEYDVRISGEFATPEQIGDVVIRANDAGNWLKIKDVARVVDTFEDETRIARINRERAVAMVVVKMENSDVIGLAKKVEETIAEFKKQLPPGMEVTVTNDFSYYVKRRLGVVKNNGLIGFALVLLMLFLFLDPVPALVTAFGVPIAIFSTCIAMQALGINVNLVSMLGLIIVLGMLVDDGIIVSENVYRYVEAGVDPKEAAVRGTQEVIAPVTATILTTCAAFTPLLFMEDILGKFIKQIPMVVMIALGASLFEAFVILPSHLSDFVSFHLGRKNGRGARRKEKRWFKTLVDFYERMLNFALNHRKKFVFGILIPLLGASVYIWIFHMKTILFSSEGIEQFSIRAEAAKGTPLEKTEELIKPVEDLVATLPATQLDAFRTYVGAIESERGFDPSARRGTHLAQITVFLTPFQTRDKTTREISDGIREKLKEIEGFKKLYIHQRKPGPPVGRAVSVGIKGEHFDVLREIAGKFSDYLGTIPGVSDIETSYEFGKKQFKVVVDEEKARKYLLDVGGIADAVRMAFKGKVATTVKPLKAEEEIDVIVRFAGERRKSLDAFDRILLENRSGHLVPLMTVADVVEENGVYAINHLDGKRVIYVQAEVDDDRVTSLEANRLLREKFGKIGAEYLGYTVKYSGEFERQQESKRNLVISFMLALSVIFIILTAVFNSLVQPFIVMLAIPFGLIGVILAFLAHGKPMSFFGLIGVVGLTGIVVNDSIVLVDFINRLRKEGRARRESLVEAGRLRLRPVLMTTLTTIGGLVSVAYGIGGGDPFLKPLALAIVWGLLFSTILTLVIIPCIYAITDDFAEHVLRRHMVKIS